MHALPPQTMTMRFRVPEAFAALGARVWLIVLVLGVDALMSLKGGSTLSSMFEDQWLQRMAGLREVSIADAIIGLIGVFAVIVALPALLLSVGLCNNVETDSVSPSCSWGCSLSGPATSGDAEFHRKEA